MWAGLNWHHLVSFVGVVVGHLFAFSPSSTMRRIVQQPMDVCKPNSPGWNQEIRQSQPRDLD